MDSDELDKLGVKLVDQDSLENDVKKKANEALISKDAELDQRRLDKAEQDRNRIVGQLNQIQRRIRDPKTKISQRKSLEEQYEWIEKNELRPIKRDIDEITIRLLQSKQALNNSSTLSEENGNERLAGETEKDFLIRTGKITAFGNESAFHQEVRHEDESKSHMYLREPGLYQPLELKDSELIRTDKSNIEKQRLSTDVEQQEGQDDEFVPDKNDDTIEDEDYDDDEVIGQSYGGDETSVSAENHRSYSRNVDDGDDKVYEERLKHWCRQRALLRKSVGSESEDADSGTEECFKSHPTISDAVLNESFRLPGDIYPSLFDYQKTCVQWLWELYTQKTGGIIGDEMGLGKTIQVISFIAGLHYSKLLEGPVLIVVPATVLNQWVNEFHRWWPPLRCVILHSIGSGMNKALISKEEKMEELLENADPFSVNKSSLKSYENELKAKEIVDSVFDKGHILITTYVGLRIYSKYILPRKWGYAILDEGHKIRNPDLDVSLTCKQIKTYNRVILSGTPIQNNLIELWSLFDFVFPGRLGTLPVFQQQFAVPINMGGYANASNVQVQTGYKCAVILRDLISPYLLRRLKSDVARDLPKKNEMVLFVKLTEYQQQLYEKFIDSEDVSAILKGKRNVLMGVDILRKICNHPDLVDRDILMHRRNYNYGDPRKSGKLQVLKNLLQLWKKEGHRILLFCQTRQMLDILEKFVGNLKSINDEGDDINGKFNYLRMDGSTPIAVRQSLVDTFNNNDYYHVFLLTTKVGGLGINLTGADRVIIYDPDWNPSTDIQARERAWRLGQKKDITIYRLMTAGSIEEKIYHRQIFKTFLTNKILKDPKQRRFFRMNDLHDLFSLGDPEEMGTETGDMFSGSEKKFTGSKARKSRKLNKPKHSNDDDFLDIVQINGVSKLDKFRDDSEEDKSHAKPKVDEDRILENIFAQSGVHSALKHDEIVDCSKQEHSLVSREAERIAAEAAAALKRSRLAARNTGVGTPTWTGKFGLAGKFGPKKVIKTANSNQNTTKLLSSGSILNSLKNKSTNKPNNSVFKLNRPSSIEKTLNMDKEQIIQKMHNFLLKQADRFGTSNDILRAIEIEISDEGTASLVRSMLREIATWNRDRKGWVLKPDFVE